MSEWQQGDVLTNGIRMHYYRTGGNKPPVVLCHGGSDAGLCWTPVAKILEADYDVIMIDARNHGLSETPPAQRHRDAGRRPGGPDRGTGAGQAGRDGPFHGRRGHGTGRR